MQTAIREVKEETNLDVQVYENKRYVIEYYPKEDVLKQVVFFVATCEFTDVKRQEEEIKNIKWLSFEDAINIITYDNSRELLKKIIKEKE